MDLIIVMVSKIIVAFLLCVAVFSQYTTPSIGPIYNPNPVITPIPYNPGPIVGPITGPFNPTPSPSPNTNSPGNGDVDIDENQASGLIRSLFGNNQAAVQSLQASSSPPPTSAPSGAALSATAPTAAQRLTASASPSLYPGSSINNLTIRWGRWVRVLRCNFNNWDGSFCCRYVWVWRYW